MKTYQLLWRMIRYRPLLYTGNAILWALIHLSPLIPGLILQQFFNTLPASTHLNPDVWLLVALLVATALARCILMLGGALTDIPHRFIMNSLLQRNLLERILERPGARAVPDSPGEAISRFRDDARQAENAVSWTLDQIGLGLFAITAVIILLTVNVLITLLVFIPLVCVIVTARIMNARLEKYRIASRKATGRVTSAIGEICGTVQAIQVAGAEAHVVEHMRTLNDARRVATLKDSVLTQTLNSTYENTLGLGTGVILLLAAHKPLYLAGPEKTLPAILPITIQENEQLETLEATELTYHYPDTGRGIEDISLRIQRGTLTVITGRIASGKTTLVQVLLGLLPGDAGEICWNGARIADPASFFVPPHSAYTAQAPRLFSSALQENILLGLPEETVDLHAAIHTAVMERDLEELEDGLQTLIGARGVKLSGGQVQRTAAARMFVRPAELLVFDDLSSALDVETEHVLWERLFDRGKRTCLVVSHRRAVLQRADHILVLKEGHLEAAGTLEYLLENCEEMRRLWSGAA
ncbi:MAG: ATP-binding cassette domain-containing protein [Ktedonobacteraceae bacterium]